MRVSTITLAAILLTASSVVAQDRARLPLDEQSKYIVSARAGIVSIVEGKATVKSADAVTAAEDLEAGQELRPGDTVTTADNSRVEILLNPGCYLRLGDNSEFVFLFEFVNNEVKLLRGSAVLEASAIDGVIQVETPKARLDVIRNGIYRFNVAADGRTEVAVRKGRVLAGKTLIKQGKRAVVEGETATLAGLSKKQVDELDDWSKDRAKALVAANRQLSSSRMRGSFLALFRNSWVYDPFCRCYAFLPYGQGYSCPYGWAYSYWLPSWYYHPRYNNGEWVSGGHGNGAPPGGTGSGGGSRSGGGSSGGGGSSVGRGGGSIGGGAGGNGGRTQPSMPSGDSHGRAERGGAAPATRRP
jgi:hypothetical protein